MGSVKQKRIIAVFDFDGTLTNKDSLFLFILFVWGRKRLCIGVLCLLPWLLLALSGLYPRWKAKERLFRFFFSGMPYEEFVRQGRLFSNEIASFSNHSTTQILREHILAKHDVYVVTASIEEWVRPYCESLNVKSVLGTKVEVVNKRLTGRFASPNCYGEEKVSRLLAIEPDRHTYCLYAYGDSRGDREMLEFADVASLV